MLRRTRRHRNALATLGLATLAILAACSSSNDDSSTSSNTAGTATASTGGRANGASGHSGAAAGSTAIGGNSGTAHGGSSGSSGNGGTNPVDTAGSGGRPQAGAGGTNLEAGAAGQAGNGDGAAGQAGASGAGPRELAYVVGLNAGVSEFELAPDGTPRPLADGVIKSTRGFPLGITVSSNQRFLYIVEDDSKLRTYALDDRGALSKDPISTASTTDIPEAIALSKDGQFLYVGQQAGIDIFAVDTTSGIPSSTGGSLALGGLAQALALSTDGKVLYAAQPAPGIRGFQVNPATGALTELPGSPFAKTVLPRGGLAITPNGKFMYASGMGLNAIAIAEDGSLTAISTYLDDILSDNYAPNVAITKDGRFVYATQFLTKQPTGNGFGLFSGFAIHEDGTLQLLDGFPRAVDNAYTAAIDPSSRFLFIGMDDLEKFAAFAIAANGGVHELEGSLFRAPGFEPLFAFATRP